MDRQIRLNRQQILQSRTLAIRELRPKPRRIDHSLPLTRRNAAYIAKSVCYEPPPIRWERGILLHRAAKLLSLRHREVLNKFIALKQLASLLRRHIVQLDEPISVTLLHFRR